MSNREPFWWPMAEPPLPQPYPAYEIGPDWEHAHSVEHVRNAYLIALGMFPPLFEVDPEETIRAANHERVMQIARRIMEEDAELLERLADDD